MSVLYIIIWSIEVETIKQHTLVDLNFYNFQPYQYVTYKLNNIIYKINWKAAPYSSTYTLLKIS